ncbi:hypothetical protein ACJMK2_017427 [Sinanodonta woodiana]|uniref:Uncharacterized protein n=1 Tax=Sinanodonta woodiana TaxID=1069815 RepID=A0ABD3UAB7_SINWO
MNDPGNSRSKRSRHNLTYRKLTMYLKSSRKVEISWDWSELFSATTVYVLIRSDCEDSVWDGMRHPEDFGNGVSLHFNSSCTPDVCYCPRGPPS